MLIAIALAVLIAGTPPKCGVERQPVKTLQDGFSPVYPCADDACLTPSTVTELSAEPMPKWDDHAPRMDSERRLVALDVSIVGYKLEADQDFHVVVADQQGATMVIEFPSASCSKYPRLATAKAAFLKLVPKPPTPSYRKLKTPIPVHVVGVPFFDLHRPGHIPTGSAKNGVEIHPVLSIEAAP